MHAEGDFGGLPRRSPLKSDFFLLVVPQVFLLEQLSHLSRTSSLKQIAEAGLMEPSFEHLLRDANVDKGTILALSHCQITDRETFVGLDDTAGGLKSLAVDMGIKLRIWWCAAQERISTAWKNAKAQLEVNTSTEGLDERHRPVQEEVRCRFTGRTKISKRDCQREPPRWATGPGDQLGGGRVARQSEARPAQTVRQTPQCPTHSPNTKTELKRGTKKLRRTASEVRHHAKHVAARSAPAARTVSVLRPRTDDFPKVSEATSQQAGLQPTYRNPRKMSFTAEVGALLVPYELELRKEAYKQCR